MQETQPDKKIIVKEIVKNLFQKGIMIDKHLISKIENSDTQKIKEKIFSDDFIASKESIELLCEEMDKCKDNPNNQSRGEGVIESGNGQSDKSQLSTENNQSKITNMGSHAYPVKINYTYNDPMKKKDVGSFVKHFNARYKTIRAMLQQRTELSNVQAIRRILEKKEKETVSTIGLIYDKQTTKNGNLVIEIEDQTGSIKMIVNKDKKELFEIAKNTVLDEVIGVTGSNGDKTIFANSIVIPDVPIGKEFKKAEDEVYAVVLADLHVGSKFFLEDEFVKFSQWLNGNVGNEKQRDIARKVKYIFIAGDLVEGIGIYPAQHGHLTIHDIYQQYEKCAELLAMIPKHLPLMIIPGNHDAMRLTEPQPVLYKDYAEALWKLPNALMLTNPAYINIHSSDNFPGFDVLLYHGYSFTYYADTVESIRQKRPTISERADLVQKFLLQRRHLSPSHSATLYVQDEDKDPLIIEKVPDFFISGHIHRAAVSNYRNVTMISGSCFQTKTPFEEKMGLAPEPGKIPLINLQTREVKILNFSIEKEEQEMENKLKGGSNS